jgi:vancomycin resistance protein VanW
MNSHGGTTHQIITRKDLAVFACKAALLRIRRGTRNLFDRNVRRWPAIQTPAGIPLAEVITPLYPQEDPGERALQLGKVQNLRVGARALNGVMIEDGKIFSFWQQLGRPTRSQGYVVGRELRQGCLIPTLAGGLCQLSNSLHQAARKSGCEILERHAHTAPIPHSPFSPGEDATVFWNYVDLRFRAHRPLILRVHLSREELVVRMEAAA